MDKKETVGRVTFGPQVKNPFTLDIDTGKELESQSSNPFGLSNKDNDVVISRYNSCPACKKPLIVKNPPPYYNEVQENYDIKVEYDDTSKDDIPEIYGFYFTCARCRYQWFEKSKNKTKNRKLEGE